MKVLTKYCQRHPDRSAVGVCVVTGQAICTECSTQHQGVNYSKEGLRRYLANERLQSRGVKAGRWLVALTLLFSPVALYLMWLGIDLSGQLIIDLLQMGRAES